MQERLWFCVASVLMYAETLTCTSYYMLFVTCRMRAENALDAELMITVEYLTIISLMRKVNIDTTKLVLGHSSISPVQIQN